MEENNTEKKFRSASFSCDKTIYRKFLEIIENTHFLE